MLRNPDPRFIALQEFCDSRAELKSSPIIELVNKVGLSIYYFFIQRISIRIQTFQVAPDVLKEHGKVRFYYFHYLSRV